MSASDGCRPENRYGSPFCCDRPMEPGRRGTNTERCRVSGRSFKRPIGGPCAPEGNLARYPKADDEACPCGTKRKCSRCGAHLRIRPNGDDEWGYVGMDGNAYCPAPALPKMPPGVTTIHELADWYADHGDPESYSMLKMAISSGRFSAKQHYQTGGECNAEHPPPPFCCGMPMYAAPRGWQCRTNKTWFPYAG